MLDYVHPGPTMVRYIPQKQHQLVPESGRGPHSDLHTALAFTTVPERPCSYQTLQREGNGGKHPLP